MLLSGNHQETVRFHILQSPRHPLLLGFPWLRRHNPHLDWTTGAILGWSSSCHQFCLKQAAAPERTTSFSTAPDVLEVRAEYLDFREMFSKARATSLPLHTPYDCGIDRQPCLGAACTLWPPLREAMDTYMNNSLVAASPFPAGVGFFFVSKKDKTLSACIGYRGLTNVTIKNHNPLPHRILHRAPRRRHHLHQARPTQRLSSSWDPRG